MKLHHSLSRLAHHRETDFLSRHHRRQHVYRDRLRRAINPTELEKELPEIRTAFRQSLSGGSYV
ncbi:MAG TPA: hypothetical protein GXZ74_07905 [Tissierellia bacterium]|nr:hypothetical protein [Tissierellia bacterium]